MTEPPASPSSTAGASSRGATADAITLELFASRFGALAREMGEMLRRTAVSTNVKERLDFSCAVLDPRGRLVVNAPHIPVHLGALGLCVRAVARAVPCEPGDVVVTNHPAYGGSHLPDVTLVTPVYEDQEPGGGLLGWVASRAHHAELGGGRPGSMPPEARTLEEEGVVLAPWRLVRGGEPRWAEMRRRLTEGRYPTRSVEENLADLAAALAANHRGATGLARLARLHGRSRTLEAMEDLRRLSCRRVQSALARLAHRLGPGPHRARHHLDDGTPLAVAVELSTTEERGTARFDFTGCGTTHPGNLNAPPAVVTSAILYVLRLLLDEPLPLNEGMLASVDVHLPPASLVNPTFPEDPRQAPAVVGGNVETSQRLVNLLLDALKLAAGSQGTMNNVLFGNARFGYYETVCGGVGATCTGAGQGAAGADAVHSHMTNTRITDPEVLEHRYPVRLEAFRVRRGSGGAGHFPGGDGVERRLRFLEELELSVVSQHRREGPHGLHGGGRGAPGSQVVQRAAGGIVTLGAVDGCTVGPGDVLVLETPGGGGCGEAGGPVSGDGREGEP